jgi:hypothetical protein
MRFVDVRNQLGKNFCDYLLTKARKYWETILSLEVSPEFLPYKEERIKTYQQLLEEYKNLLPAKDIEKVIFLGRDMNNRGLYFEGHEIIEKYWLTYKGKYKKFLQALIQVSIANMHLESGNLKGYHRMKELAIKNLSEYSGNLFNIDVEKLKNTLQKEGEFFISY